MEKLEDYLHQIPLFAKATPKNLQRAIERKDCGEIGIAVGGSLSAGEKCLGILLCGAAQVLSNDEGRTVILRMLRPGDVFGAAALFCPEELPLSRIEATAPCTVFRFTKDAMRELISADPAVLDAYLTFLAGRVRYLNRKICCFTAGSAPRRLALWLLSEEHDTITLPSLSALSDMLDIGRASLYRAFDNLVAENLIQKSGRVITILDRKRLSEYYH